jgi:hypothetical protein
MKRAALGVVVFIFTILLGVVVWRFSLDSAIYPVTFCNLIQDSRRYDRKLVRVQVIYNSGIDTASLTDSSCKGNDEWIRPTCSASDGCLEIYGMMDKARQNAGSRWGGAVRLEVTGRYYASVRDPDRNQGSGKVHFLEIIEGKDAKFISEDR